MSGPSTAGRAGARIARAARCAAVLGLALGAAGCGWFDRKIVRNLTGYSILCVKETNVSYVQGPSGLAPLVSLPDGKPVPCQK